MFSRFLTERRWKKIQKTVKELNYEVRPRVLAFHLAKLVNVDWVTKHYSVSKAENIILRVKTTNPVQLVQSMTRILEIVRNREYLDHTDKALGVVRNTSLYDWLVDKERRVISPTVVTKELQVLVVELSQEISGCKLSREDLYDYYQYSTQGYMEDAAEFLEAMLSLKLRK